MSNRVSDIKAQVERETLRKATDDKALLFSKNSSSNIKEQKKMIKLNNLKEIDNDLIVEDLETPRVEGKDKAKK